MRDMLGVGQEGESHRRPEITPGTTNSPQLSHHPEAQETAEAEVGICDQSGEDESGALSQEDVRVSVEDHSLSLPPPGECSVLSSLSSQPCDGGAGGGVAEEGVEVERAGTRDVDVESQS